MTTENKSEVNTLKTGKFMFLRRRENLLAEMDRKEKVTMFEPMGWNWEFQFESWNVVLGKTQKFWFFNPFATHLSPDAKVGIQMEIGVEKQKI